MFLLLTRRCTRLSPNGGGLAFHASRKASSLRPCLSRATGTLPPFSSTGVPNNRGFSTAVTEVHPRGNVPALSCPLNAASRSARSNGTSPPLRTFAKRNQHSAVLEATSDLDHAPIIAGYPEWIKPQDTLPRRHIGPTDEEIQVMLKELGLPDLDAFIRQTIPDSIRASKEFTIPSEQTPETEMLDELTKAGKANSAADVDTYIGMGYHPTITPGVIKRNVLENPGWYTSYTPYQPEISQGD